MYLYNKINLKASKYQLISILDKWLQINRCIGHRSLFGWLGIKVNFCVFRHHCLDSSCYRCNETIFHCLRHCPMATRVWNLLRLNITQTTMLHSQWICGNSLADHGSLFAIAGCWFIWKSGNDLIFQGVVRDDWYIRNQILNLAIRRHHQKLTW